jgi:hypothetical protein
MNVSTQSNPGVVAPVGDGDSSVNRAGEARESRELAEALDVKFGESSKPNLLVVIPPPRNPGGNFDLPNLYGRFSDGLQNGFYAADLSRLMEKVNASKESGVPLSVGEVTAEMLNVQAKIGIGDACGKIAAKLAEGLQSLVVRQS